MNAEQHLELSVRCTLCSLKMMKVADLIEDDPKATKKMIEAGKEFKGIVKMLKDDCDEKRDEVAEELSRDMIKGLSKKKKKK